VDKALPALTLKERQRRQREELILHSTEEVLMEKGYHEMSMDEIAARVGIAKGTLYLHFAKKEDLVFALLEREIGRLNQILEQAQAQETSAQGKLEFLVQMLYQQLVEAPNKLLSAIFSSADVQHLLKEKHETILGGVWSTIMQLLAEGQDHGEFDPAIPLEVMLDAFMSIAFARMRSLLMRKHTLPTQEANAILLCIFFRGICVSETANEAYKTE
jgi:AcrR family transcriptional regulator